MYGDDPERILGQRLRGFREEAAMTQAQLAEVMTGQGFPMHQTTIAKIEAAQRPVTVNEAVRFAAILGLRLPDLLADPDLDEETAAVREEHRQAAAWKIRARAAHAELQARRAQIDVELSAALREREEADAAEADAWRRYRLARRRSAGHSPADGED